MGVASEIPLADVEAYLKDAFDNIHLSELDSNAKSLMISFIAPYRLQ